MPAQGAQGSSAVKLVKALLEAGLKVTAGVWCNQQCASAFALHNDPDNDLEASQTTLTGVCVAAAVDFPEQAQATLAFVKK
jgi:hypothetical protein